MRNVFSKVDYVVAYLVVMAVTNNLVVVDSPLYVRFPLDFSNYVVRIFFSALSTLTFPNSVVLLL